MVCLRATKRVLTRLPATSESAGHSDTALGDWYVNRIVVDRRPLLLLLSSRSYLAILAPARDVASLPTRLPGLVAARLRRLDADASLIAKEYRAMEPVVVGPTTERRVVGMMVDFAKMIPYYLDVGSWDAASLLEVERKLEDNPCHAGRPMDQTIWPARKTLELLKTSWRA